MFATVLRTTPVVVVLACCVPSRAAAQESAPRYKLQPNQQFAFEMEIQVEGPGETTTFKGVTRYTVNAVRGDHVDLTYQGGLTESKQTKESASSRNRPFGPPFGPRFGPPRIPSPFARQEFRGRVQTTNQITLTTQGQTLSMRGDSQLPYLLGNVSLLPFESLPATPQRQWTQSAGVSVEQKEERTGPPFGPFGPFSRSDDGQQQAAEEVTEYSVDSEAGGTMAVKKTYRLKSPGTSNGPTFEINGSGVWVFNRPQGLPDSLKFNQQLVIKEDNQQTTFPTSIFYRRLSSDEVAKLDAEAKQRQRELQEKMAAEKRQKEAPLTDSEKQDVLTKLAATDPGPIGEALTLLRGRKPLDPDADVASAIEPLLTHPNPKVRSDATAALRNWSPDFDRRQKLKESYDSHMPVESSDLEVNATTDLFVGQIIQFQDIGTFWYPGEILELLPDGKVKVRKRKLDRREITVTRRNLQLAPPEVEQPPRPAATVAAQTTTPAAPRT
ncbi:MAG: hypothetical protein AB7O38_26005, partial [Pirellulaceae bacterium]